MNIRDRIEALLSHLNRGVYEKETAIQLALLTAIAGESIFYARSSRGGQILGC